VKYLNGRNSDLVEIWNSVIVTTQYMPLNQQEIMMSLFSGGSNYKDSLSNKIGFLITAASTQSSFQTEP
jgi:hypothetical protein